MRAMGGDEYPIHHLSIHGNDVAYRRAGNGPVLVLLHGIAGSSETWLPVMRLLQRDYTVLAPDFLGHGSSAKPPGDYSLGNLAAGLRDFLHMLEVKRATVVGQSYGGGVAMQFAYQFPERCERLVLVDAGGLGREVSWMLRLVTLPGAEYLLPVLFSTPVRDCGDSMIRFLQDRGIRYTRATEVWRSFASLTEASNRGRVRPDDAGRDRTGWASSERYGSPLFGRRHASSDRLGRQGQDHSPQPRLPGARGHSEQPS